MIELTQLPYFLILLLAPLLLNGKNAKVNMLIFTLISCAVYILGGKSIMMTVVGFAWILFPFFYRKFFEQKAPLFIIMAIFFLYFNRYDWIFSSLHIPYFFTIKLFGLSYIVFRQVDYIMQYDESSPNNTLIHYLAYVISFYTIISGPIERFHDFIADFYAEKKIPTLSELLTDINRILNGFIKVFILSYFCMLGANHYFAVLQKEPTILAFAIFAVLNVAFIYFNFSGYCDIVIAFAKIAGLKVSENFNKPYLARDINDFWGRQHITLTRWITSYIFTPVIRKLLALKLSINSATYIAFFITFLFAGLWHGTTLNYLIYGLLQAIGVCLTKLYIDSTTKLLGGKKAFKEYRKKKIVHVTEIIFTQIYICLSFSFIGYDFISLFIGTGGA